VALVTFRRHRRLIECMMTWRLSMQVNGSTTITPSHSLLFDYSQDCVSARQEHAGKSGFSRAPSLRICSQTNKWYWTDSCKPQRVKLSLTTGCGIYVIGCLSRLSINSPRVKRSVLLMRQESSTRRIMLMMAPRQRHPRNES